MSGGATYAPSAEVPTALAEALRLDPGERQHLFILADRPSPQSHASGAELVPDALIFMLQSMKNQPAYVPGRRWDVLTWNEAPIAVFGGFELLEGDAATSCT